VAIGECPRVRELLEEEEGGGTYCMFAPNMSRILVIQVADASAFHVDSLCSFPLMDNSSATAFAEPAGDFVAAC
jgi:hypothetical protein